MVKAKGSKPTLRAVTEEGWMDVSIDGFAAQNAARPPGHLVKELLQNALDACGETPEAIIGLTFQYCDDGLQITCTDNGVGIRDLRTIRTMFFTSKTDSHLKRGRLGRGFKEMLCLAKSAGVASTGRELIFAIEKDKRIIKEGPYTGVEHKGTIVSMLMPWERSVISDLELYFSHIIVPPHVTLKVNNETIRQRQPNHRLTASLPTEMFTNSVWTKPVRNCVVHLVRTIYEEEPMIYEMGIPVCPAEWDQKFHINVLQRVPMNPNRDAVASGYPNKLHKACLLTLLPAMRADDAKQEWVGEAAAGLPADAQQEIIHKAFGANIAREVPVMGKRNFNEDARDLGKDVVPTRTMSAGFRQIVQEHVPSAADVVTHHELQELQMAADTGFFPQEAFRDQTPTNIQRQRLINDAGGQEHVNHILDFGKWFCSQLLKNNSVMHGECRSARIGILRPVNACMSWSDSDILTVGIDSPEIWAQPFSAKTLGIFVHEAAHHMAMHHGYEFHKEVEHLAGVAAKVMLDNADHIRKEWKDLLA